MAVGERVGVGVVGVGGGNMVGVGSKGIVVGEVDPVHAVRDTSTTRAMLIKRFLYQVIQIDPLVAEASFGGSPIATG